MSDGEHVSCQRVALLMKPESIELKMAKRFLLQQILSNDITYFRSFTATFKNEKDKPSVGVGYHGYTHSSGVVIFGGDA